MNTYLKYWLKFIRFKENKLNIYQVRKISVSEYFTKNDLNKVLARCNYLLNRVINIPHLYKSDSKIISAQKSVFVHKEKHTSL